jgi:hypothetical protein
MRTEELYPAPVLGASIILLEVDIVAYILIGDFKGTGLQGYVVD